MRLLTVVLCLLPTAALADVPKVVTDIAPVQSLVAGVMHGLGTPELLVGPGTDPHHMQLRPSQARLLAGADAVFWIGTGLTPWLGEVIEATAPQAVSVQLSQAAGVIQRAPLFAADGESGEGHGHGHEAFDPHVWLDPANDRAMTREIAARLSSLDPANAAIYAANAGAVLAALDRAEAETRAILAPHETARLVVYHDGYAHFAAAFNVTITASVADSEAADPGAARLSSLRRMIADQGADCLFDEPQHGARTVAALAADTGVHRATLDPLGTDVGPEPGAVLTGLARSIDRCLAGE